MGKHHVAPARSRQFVIGGGALTVVAASAVVVAMHIMGGSAPAKASTPANDAAASADARNAVAVIEQCNAENVRYPSTIDPTTGAVDGCAQRATLSAGSTIAYFTSSSSAYILSVTNASNGVTGQTYCYSSTAGAVTTIPAPLTAYRSSC